jgi:PAS domain S-box-containing protein
MSSAHRPDDPPALDLYRALVEGHDDALYVKALDGRYLLVNPGAALLVSREAADFLGRTDAELFVPDLARGWRDQDLAVMADGRPLTVEQTLPGPGGGRTLLTRKAPFRDAAGAVVGVIGIGRDITDARRAEEALRRSERLLSALIENAPIAVALFDAQGVAVRHNEALRRLYGVPSAGYGLGRFNVLTDPLSAALGDAELFRRATAGEVVVLRDRAVDLGTPANAWETSRGVLHLDQFIFPIQDEGELQGLGSFAIDVSERHAAEARRRELEQKLQETQRLEGLGVLAGGVAHQFNNLLTLVLGHAGLAAVGLPEGGPARQHLSQIESAANRAAELCRQMLAFAGRGASSVGPVGLAELVRQTAALVRASLPPGGELRLDLAEGLPPLRADAAQLRQVVVGLAVNAVEALPEQGGLLTLAVGRERLDRARLGSLRLGPGLPEGEYLTLTVTDTGCGMTEEVLGRIFEPFFSTKLLGRGLGLAAVLGIVRAHKGALEARSAPGQGSTFRLYFPAAQGG